MQKMEQLTTRYIQQNSLYRFDHNRSQKQEIILKQEKNILQAKANNSLRMNTLYYSFIMSFLKENYPEILKSIDRIYEPDLSKISQVIDCYCEFVNIPSQQIMGEYINYKDIQHRYKAIAVVLRIFQPEKLDNLKTKVKSSIYKELGPYLKINSDTLQKSIICACNQFDLYREFKKEIKQVANYYLINARLNNA
ncbi:hypothetical protein [Sphingobacterium sp.]|uniref:hypothetical protein n=1 Tax=Sphingobacterium sp. TaxID=341027 RepID=UPI00289B5FAE|nr:hypothetical protein [Sphingobacterium sp.]